MHGLYDSFDCLHLITNNNQCVNVDRDELLMVCEQLVDYRDLTHNLIHIKKEHLLFPTAETIKHTQLLVFTCVNRMAFLQQQFSLNICLANN